MFREHLTVINCRSSATPTNRQDGHAHAMQMLGFALRVVSTRCLSVSNNDHNPGSKWVRCIARSEVQNMSHWQSQIEFITNYDIADTAPTDLAVCVIQMNTAPVTIYVAKHAKQSMAKCPYISHSSPKCSAPRIYIRDRR